MKQVLQNLRTGSTELVDVPIPAVGRGELLVRTRRSLISAGTERMLVEFGNASWREKARQQPDKVKLVLDKARTDGVLPTIDAVMTKLDKPLPMGYSNCGVVEAVGEGVKGYAVGDRVVSNGHHAELVSVPVNLAATVPDTVSDESAAFAVIGAIGLQGMRLAEPTLGESVVVIGLGLIGLVTVQLLKANGCRVLGVDPDPSKSELARSFGATVVDVQAGQDLVAAALDFSRGRGVDAVLITASTKSSEPVRQAARMCRKRGRIVLVGVSGLELSRADFYEKELTFQVSCSYGPGRYDPGYEHKGHDYPIGFVRWTEQRNFEAVLDMMAAGRLEVQPLITHRFKLDRVKDAYSLITSDEPSLGVLLEYAANDARAGSPMERVVKVLHPGRGRDKTPHPTVSVVGAGGYAASVLIPAFRRTGARLLSVSSNTGVSSAYAARKFGFEEATTDTEALLADDRADAVVIATRHDSHAGLVLKALQAGRHVFVEKPLCLRLEDLDAISRACNSQDDQASEGASANPLLMVGFNRRFAPHVVKIRSLLDGLDGPKSFVLTVNAGFIPPDHWTQDAEAGGGRIVGEACHFIDLLRFLANSPIESYGRLAMDGGAGDTVTLQLRFVDGSIGSVHYFANGSRALAKERLEIFASGQVLQLDNFRVLRGYGSPVFRRMRLWQQDKGQAACASAFVEALRQGGPPPIPLNELLEVSRVAIELSKDA